MRHQPKPFDSAFNRIVRAPFSKCVATSILIIALAVPALALAAGPGYASVPQNQDTPSNEVLPDVNVATPKTDAQKDEAVDPNVREKGLNLLTLLGRGGWFMIPLGLISILVVAVSVERFLALREEKMMPTQLVRELGQLSRQDEGFDPRQAYRACQSYPSAAARVIRAMLLKVGRPQSEVDHAVKEASEREATRLQSVVSWLTLAAAVAPLIGLLGTVWGMIQAFYDTTQLLPGQNKAEVLAQGIYTALVTTMSGLVIAIPSAVMAHFFDNKIVAWFHRIDEMTTSLTPMIEQFEGKLRTSADGTLDPVPAQRQGRRHSESGRSLDEHAVDEPSSGRVPR